jgi:hypothetical protein
VERLLDRHALCAAASITSPSRGDPCWQTLVGLRVESVLRIDQHYHDSAEIEITTISADPLPHLRLQAMCSSQKGVPEPAVRSIF